MRALHLGQAQERSATPLYITYNHLNTVIILLQSKPQFI